MTFRWMPMHYSLRKIQHIMYGSSRPQIGSDSSPPRADQRSVSPSEVLASASLAYNVAFQDSSNDKQKSGFLPKTWNEIGDLLTCDRGSIDHLKANLANLTSLSPSPTLYLSIHLSISHQWKRGRCMCLTKRFRLVLPPHLLTYFFTSVFWPRSLLWSDTKIKHKKTERSKDESKH